MRHVLRRKSVSIILSRAIQNLNRVSVEAIYSEGSLLKKAIGYLIDKRFKLIESCTNFPVEKPIRYFATFS